MILFTFAYAQANEQRRYNLGESIIVEGRFDSTTVPHRLVVDENTDNQEYVFLKNVKPRDVTLYHNLLVIIKGRVVEGQYQYHIDVNEIKIKKDPPL
ncbi:MAG: hypothetical protein JNM93_11820 [Bacteriovoracaceae bacterium]|nr:hypothetical protein [Bacteriovoracaceae bacterium]